MAFDPPTRLRLDMRVADDAILVLAAGLGAMLLIVFLGPLHFKHYLAISITC
jgi:hypothetical protein